jgi:hypothetical protein
MRAFWRRQPPAPTDAPTRVMAGRASRSPWWVRWTSRDARLANRGSWSRYWIWRRRRETFRFWARTKGFSVRSELREMQESSGLGRSLVRRILPSLLWAVVLVAVAELISRPSALPDAPGWLLQLFQPLEATEFEPFALTAAQVGGTLLALYFATVGVVASTAYANAPHRIRLLFVRERSGRFYTKTVALLVTAALIVVGLARVGVTIHALTILVLIAVAVFAVLSLVVLGVTIFNFFDPASLATTLVADFVLWVNAASAGSGRLWEDASFQDYYQRQAAGVLETFEELLELIVSTQRSDYRRVADLAGSAARMQQYYSGRKSRIPTKSRWYPRRYQHPSWLTAADTQRSMALATGTAMQPKEVPGSAGSLLGGGRSRQRHYKSATKVAR